MSETNETAPYANGNGQHAGQRKPLRPAPPVPVNGEQTSSEVINNGRIQKNCVNSRSKRQHLRQRKIHSLKRQIQIKESMLEVTIKRSVPFFTYIDKFYSMEVWCFGSYI